MKVYNKKSLTLRESTYKKKNVKLKEDVSNSNATELGGSGTVPQGADATYTKTGQAPNNVVKTTVPILKGTTGNQANIAGQNKAKEMGKFINGNQQIETNFVEVDPSKTDSNTIAQIKQSYTPNNTSSLTLESITFSKKEMTQFLNTL